RVLNVAAGNVYSACLLCFLLLRSTPLREMWWLRLAADFLPFLFVPLIVLVPAVLLCARSRVAKAFVSLPCLVFALVYGRLFLPQPTVASSSPQLGLSVMSYNVTRGAPGVDNILAIIESEGADVVALQEVTPQVAQALSGLSELYPHMALHPTLDGYAGCAVLSRFPISDDEAFPLVEGAHLYQQVVLDVNGARLDLLNVHLQPPRLTARWLGESRVFIPAGYDTSFQDEELKRLLTIVDAVEGRVILAGDLNMTDQSPGYRELRRRLLDAYREAGWGFGHTFPDMEVRSMPTPFPLVRIDYIFHSRDMRASRSYVGDRGGPDHRFLVAELSF
ncbi:MAG TPA: endonuclease/exonuclease/phosphatase family protein, partial [Anaerolineae bacterium]|nr:endonuclease/exonuclease/phosphatase family protein [Anaerolineae bacterium]